VFKSGNSAAVRLPASLGFAPGELVTIEKRSDGLHIRPARDPERIKKEWLQLAADLEAIWAAHGGPPERPQEREPFESPDRPVFSRVSLLLDTNIAIHIRDLDREVIGRIARRSTDASISVITSSS
jgi:virulence-associated protein VagC